MDFSIKYFKDYISFHVDDSHPVKELLPHPCEEADIEEEEIRRALAHPISSARLSEIVKAGEKVVIITSDVTRPVPSWLLIPCVLQELEAAGVREEDITVVFALGSHRHLTEEEREPLPVNGRITKCNASTAIRKTACILAPAGMGPPSISSARLPKPTAASFSAMSSTTISPVIPAA